MWEGGWGGCFKTCGTGSLFVGVEWMGSKYLWCHSFADSYKSCVPQVKIRYQPHFLFFWETKRSDLVYMETETETTLFNRLFGYPKNRFHHLWSECQHVSKVSDMYTLVDSLKLIYSELCCPLKELYKSSVSLWYQAYKSKGWLQFWLSTWKLLRTIHELFYSNLTPNWPPSPFCRS